MRASSSELFQEMKALTLRYGVDSCEHALKAVKSETSRRQLVKRDPRDTSTSSVVQISDVREAFGLVAACMLSGRIPKKLSLRVGDEDELRKGCRLWEQLESDHTYYIIRRDQPLESSNAFQQIQSRFDTLYIESEDMDVFCEICEYTKCIALFQKVVVENFLVFDAVEKLVVEDGVISSLKLDHCSFRGDGWAQFAKMLAVNRLQSLEIMRTDARSQSFPHALIHYLEFHTEKYADGSILRHLDLDDSLLYVDMTTFANLLDTIGDLPNLESFGICEPRDHNSLETMVGAIRNWKVPHFKLRQGMTGSSDMQPFFDHVGSSDHLKILSLCSHSYQGLDHIPEHWTRHLLDLALSTTSGLTDIDLDGCMISPESLSTLIPQDCDPSIAAQRRLRRFYLVPEETLRTLARKDEGEDVFEFWRALLRLLSKHLPYLYDIGLRIEEDWPDYNNVARSVQSEMMEFDLWKKIGVQMERNRVGMALLESEALRTVPGGMWPIVLHRAVTCELNPAELPWTGIYQLVRALVEDGHTPGWSKKETSPLIGRSKSRSKRPRTGAT